VRPETTELRALIRDYSLWKLNQSGGDAAGLAKDLRTVNDAYFFKRMAELDQTSGAPQQGDSYVFRKSSPAGDVIVTVNGYVTGELATPNRDIVIQGFRKEGGGYVYAGETGESLFSIMIYHNLDVLPSPIYNEMWLLVSGQVGGFMGDLEKARIFSFDGYRFEELWKPEDRLGMEIDVKGDRLDVVYDHKVDQPHGFPVHHVMEEKLWLSPNGVTRTEIIDNGPGSLPLRKLKQ